MAYSRRFQALARCCNPSFHHGCQVTWLRGDHADSSMTTFDQMLNYQPCALVYKLFIGLPMPITHISLRSPQRYERARAFTLSKFNRFLGYRVPREDNPCRTVRDEAAKEIPP